MSLISKPHKLEITFAADGTPNGVTAVSADIMDVAIGTVQGMIDDKTVVTGVARLAQMTGAYYIGRQAERLIKGQKVRLAAWKEGDVPMLPQAA